MKSVPAELMSGPFTRATASELGVTPQMLRGSRFIRVHPGVWRYRDSILTEPQEIYAARLVLPDAARLTDLSRIRMLGLSFGARRPMRFVVQGDLHLDIEGVFLHRTASMPPCDEGGVVPAAAFIAFCARCRVIDAIKVGDWLLHEELLSLDELIDLAQGQRWRAGAAEAVWVSDLLASRSRSVKESETCAILTFAGLPRPELNVATHPSSDLGSIGDLVYRDWGVVVEYEGVQHQLDRDQYLKDLDRYAAMRRSHVPYVQVTKEKLARPQSLVGEVFRALIAAGYAGPEPLFGERWRTLFAPVRDLVRFDRRRRGVRRAS